MNPPLQRMERAPRLPPVLDAAEVRALWGEHSGSAKASSAAPANPDQARAMAGVGAFLHEVIARHREYLESSASLERQFFSLQETIVKRAISLAAPPAPTEPLELVVDARTDRWLADHCPTWTVPTVPMVMMADFIAAAAQAKSGRAVREIIDLQVRRFVVAPGAVRLRVELNEAEGETLRATLLAWRDARTASLSRFEVVATAEVHLGARRSPPPPLAPIEGIEMEDPYLAGTVFHGPAFQCVASARSSAKGSSGVVRIDRCAVPRGVIAPGLLDAAFHIIRADQPWRFWPDAPRARAALPHRIDWLRLYESLPDNAIEARIESRPGKLEGDLATLEMQLIAGEAVVAAMRVTLILLPSAFGEAKPSERRAFIRDRKYLEGVALARCDGEVTRLDEETLRRVDWIPGNVARVYGIDPERQSDLVAEVAIRDHVARRAKCHPALIKVTLPNENGDAFAEASTPAGTRFPLRIQRHKTGVAIVDTEASIRL